MKKILFLSLYLFALAAVAAESDMSRTKDRFDDRCAAARAERLRPIQDRKIAECMAAPAPHRGEKMDREQCERYWRDFGWGAMRADGTRNISLFAEIPECRTAHSVGQIEER